MLLGFGQIVHNAFALQMRGQRVAATRLCSGAAVGRCGRIFERHRVRSFFQPLRPYCKAVAIPVQDL